MSTGPLADLDPAAGFHSLESVRMPASTPTFEHGFDVVAEPGCRIELQVIGAMPMDGLKVAPRVAKRAVATGALSSFELFKWAMQADKVDVESVQEPDQVRHPAPGLDDVLDDQVIAGQRQPWQAAMKAVEECGSQGGPFELVRLDALPRQHLAAEVIDRVVPEGCFHPRLQRATERGLPRARSAIDQDDCAGHDSRGYARGQRGFVFGIAQLPRPIQPAKDRVVRALRTDAGALRGAPGA